ncbi:hypothetical protein HS088_TW18G00160 [Tripterygium wilfordii]|uniref:Uncharacterized protein n=1 Tax=Tripterygium wilfordii TaxID=458696 RepID=A0A7J7CBK9_TRIWF|nr:hypothetical protein HS088_TW18G00160 [Tripterygium wilfordii]
MNRTVSFSKYFSSKSRYFSLAVSQGLFSIEVAGNWLCPCCYGEIAINQQEEQQPKEYKEEEEEETDFSNSQFTDFLNDPDDYDFCNNNNCNISASSIDYMTTSLESCLTEKEDSGSKEMDLDCCWNDAAQTYSGDSNLGGGGEEDGEEEEEGTDIVALDFNFLDNVGSSYYYSPFEIAEEIEEPVEPEYCGDEPSMLRAAMKRMKYERKFSASLYAFNGIPECLKLRLASQNVKGRARSDHSTKLQKACDDYKEEERNANEDNTEVMKKQEERGGSNSNIRTSIKHHMSIDPQLSHFQVHCNQN